MKTVDSEKPIQQEISFEKWYQTLKKAVERRTGYTFNEKQFALEEYNNGRDVKDVIIDKVYEYKLY